MQASFQARLVNMKYNVILDSPVSIHFYKIPQFKQANEKLTNLHLNISYTKMGVLNMLK